MANTRLDLADARGVWDDGYPDLQLVVDGRPAALGSEPKPTLHRAGIVFVGSDFADLLPPIEFQPPDGGPNTLRGFSADPRLWKLYDDFLRACAAGTFTPGPVAIPA